MVLLAFTLVVSMFVVMSLASLTLFNPDKNSLGNSLIRWTTFACSCGLLCIAISHEIVAWQAGISVAILSGALGLIIWALSIVREHDFHVAFTGGCGSELVVNGPYRYFSNPLYLSYVLYWAAWMPLTNMSLASVGVLGFFSVLYFGAALDERKVLRERFGDKYSAYLRTVIV